MADRSPGEPASAAAADAPVELSWFKALADHAPYFFGLATLEGQMLFINRAGLAMIGQEDANPRSLTVASMLAPETWAWTRDEKIPALRAKGIWTGETVLVHRDGHRIPVQQVLVLLRDEAGQPARMATILQDMTELKQRESELRQFKALVDAMPDLVALVTQDSRLTYLNAGGQRMLGLEGKALQEIDPRALVTPEALKQGVEEVMPALERHGVWSGESELRHASGAVIPVSRVAAVIRGPGGEAETFVTWASDLSAQKQLEQALREAIRSMSTPILQVWDGVLALPVIGVVDSERATHMTEALLGAIPRHGCRVAILDLTGMETLDTSTLEHLLRMVRAAGLLGSRCVISGISAAAAQAITALGVDLGGLSTFRSLREALSHAIRFCQQGG